MKSTIIPTLALTLLAVTAYANTLPGNGKTNMHIEHSQSGYNISFTTKFTFRDRVTYASEMNGSGTGEIMSIDIDLDGVIRYTILRADNAWQSGILEEEITLLEAAQ